MTDAATAIAPASGISIVAAFAALGVSRASVMRRRARLELNPLLRGWIGYYGRYNPSALLLDMLHAPRFADQAPAEIYAALLDEGVYRCSIRTMYRILNHNAEIRERRAQLRHSVYQKSELLAERPNEVWSWDITKLKGPAKWRYFCLYVIIDIYSRRVVGWCVADAESAILFKALFDDAITKHRVPPGQLTLHADRGGPTKAKATALLLSDLGVAADKGWLHTGERGPIRLLMHATDPANLARRIGRPASEGCVRVPADMNRFMDRHGVLDADYQQMATYDAAYRAILSDNADPTPLTGDTLVVVDSSEE